MKEIIQAEVLPNVVKSNEYQSHLLSNMSVKQLLALSGILVGVFSVACFCGYDITIDNTGICAVKR